MATHSHSYTGAQEGTRRSVMHTRTKGHESAGARAHTQRTPSLVRFNSSTPTTETHLDCTAISHRDSRRVRTGSCRTSCLQRCWRTQGHGTAESRQRCTMSAGHTWFRRTEFVWQSNDEAAAQLSKAPAPTHPQRAPLPPPQPPLQPRQPPPNAATTTTAQPPLLQHRTKTRNGSPTAHKT